MIYHAFGVFVPPNEIPLQGINYLDKKVVEFAQQHQLKIKLIGEAQRTDGVITAKVEPQFIDTKHDFYNVENEYNGVLIDAEYTGEQFVKGKGAGSFPTALAVLSNLKDIQYDLSIHKIIQEAKCGQLQKANQKIYFIAGFDVNNTFQPQQIYQSGKDYIIAKISFHELKQLQIDNKQIYSVKISNEIYQEITNQDVFI
jgi:homoserine dehydrogenase